MIGLIQRVKNAKVEVNNEAVGKINHGILLLLGVEQTDTEQTAEKLCERILKYRIFGDENGKMNLNVNQVDGQLLVISQFTLVADTRKGNRPGFSQGASPALGKALYQHFIQYAKSTGITVESGQFGADMQVYSCNDGPVTFHLHV
jgi:D-tyrosyl-tRNA(Tyr) deacylase